MNLPWVDRGGDVCPGGQIHVALRGFPDSGAGGAICARTRVPEAGWAGLSGSVRHGTRVGRETVRDVLPDLTATGGVMVGVDGTASGASDKTVPPTRRAR